MRWPLPYSAVINGKFTAFRATELKHPVNDALRCVALVMAPANDDNWFGGRA